MMDWKVEDIVISDQLSVWCEGIITDGKWKEERGKKRRQRWGEPSSMLISL